MYYNGYNYLSILGLKLNRVSKRGPWCWNWNVPDNLAKIMAAGAMISCVSKSSVTNTVQLVLVFHVNGFELSLSSQCWPFTENAGISLWFLIKKSARQGLIHLSLVPHICFDELIRTGSGITCRLFGAKALPEPMLTCCQFDSWEQFSVTLELEF